MSSSTLFGQSNANKTAKIIGFIFLAILAVVPYIYSILYAPVSLDGSYYLSMVERIRDGLIPYRDFTLEYTPVFFYITAFLKNLFSIGINYTFDLSFHFCLQLFVAFLLYKISDLIIQRKDYSYYVAIFYLLISYWITQYEFILEIPSMMWGFWAIYLAIKHKEKTTVFILVGTIASISFLTKQYGFGFLFLLIYLILFNSNRWKQLMFFLIGYSIPILLFLIFIPEISTVLFGNGYGIQAVEKSVPDFFIDVLRRMGEACFYFVYRVPVLLVALGLFQFIPRNQRKYAGLLLFGIAGFMLQFVFALFNHYALYIIPFVSLYTFMILNNIDKNKIIFRAYLVILLVVFSFANFKNYSRALSFNRELRSKQFHLAEKIKQKIEPGKTLYIADVRLVDLYYLMNVKPTNMRYTFGLTMTEELHFKQLHDANYILTCEIPDGVSFTYLNTDRVNKYLAKIPLRTVIEKQVFFDKNLNKTIEMKILLLRNK